MKEEKNICSNKHVKLERIGDEITLFIIGDFEYSTTPFIDACCKSIPYDEGIKKIILDFKMAQRVDTSAFACIINHVKKHAGSAAGLVVANLKEPQEELLNILKIEKIITLHRD